MSISLAIALNVLIAVVVLGGWAWMVFRARRLTPHVSSAERRQQLAIVHRIYGEEAPQRHERAA